MKNILHITSSPRGHRSYSISLGKAVIQKLNEKNIYHTIMERDLTKDLVPFLSDTQIGAYYQDPDSLTDDEKHSLLYSDTVINEIQNADIVVLSTPMHNLGVSAPLKAWIDQIIRAGVSFHYDHKGSKVGLLKNKKMYIAIASGSIYPNKGNKIDYIESYLKIVLKSVGITDITVFRIEGTAKKEYSREIFEEITANL